MFDNIFAAIEKWMRELLSGMVESNLSTMFTAVNQQTSEIAAQVGQTPQGWNSSIFSMIRNISDSVVIPIAGIIITLILCYELISMLTERNNLGDHHIHVFCGELFCEGAAIGVSRRVRTDLAFDDDVVAVFFFQRFFNTGIAVVERRVADVLNNADGLDILGGVVVVFCVVAGSGVHSVLGIIADVCVGLGFGFAAGGEHDNGKGSGEDSG